MPNNSVGGVSVSVKLDDRDALKQLDSLKAKIAKLNDSLSQKRAQRDSIAAEMEKAEVSAERARQKVAQLQAALASAPKEGRAGIRAQLTAANADLREQTRNLDGLNRQWQKLDGEITTGEASLSGMTDQAANLEKQVAASTGIMAKLSTATSKATKKMERAFSRLGLMIRRVFVITVILSALRGFRDYLESILLSTPEFTTALGQLKGALLTLVQPLMAVVIPALTRFIQIITNIITLNAALVSRMFGTTFEASQEAASALNDQAEAYEDTGKAAKKASKSLAAFDQINILNNPASEGTKNKAIEPRFDQNGAFSEDQLRRLLDIITAIGAALAGWKIGTALGMGLADILGLMMLLYSIIQFIKEYLKAWDEGITWDNLKKLLAWLALAALAAYLAFGKAGAGIVLLLGGIALAILAIKDAWENGVTWENMTAMLAGIGIAALGAYLLFGKLGAALALILGGLSLVTLAFHDMNENGMTLQNTLTLIAGLFAAGLGLSVLTGSFIPLALAALASLIVWLVYAFGEGEEFTEGMKKIFGGLGQFFKRIFAGDVEGAIEGLKVALEGLKQVGAAVGMALKTAWQELLNWLGQKLGPEWKAFFERIGGYFGAWVANLKLGLNGIITFIKGVFTGDLELAMQGVRDVGIAIGNSLLEFIAIVTNGFVDAINVLIGGLNSIVGDIPDWVELFGLVIPGLPTALVSLKGFQTLPHWTPPRLAQGAVIPPNREFMAVLGDQKSGTNIEAPLETIVQAFRQALGERGGSRQTIILQVDKHEFGRVTFDAYNAESQRVGMRLGGNRV